MKTLASLLLSAFAASAAQALVVDFNGPAYSTGNLGDAAGSTWVVNGNASSYTIGAGGLSPGAGTLQEIKANVTGPEASAFFNTSFDPSAGSITVSAFFRYGTVGSNGGTPLTIGFAGNTATNLFNSSAGASDMFLVRINKPAANTGQLTLQTRVAGSAVTAATGSLSSFALTGTNWYYLETTLVRTGTANQFTQSTALHNANSAGVIGSLIDSISATTLTSATLYADTSLFTGIRGFNTNGLVAVDNFSVSQIPEPSAFATLAGLGVLGLAASRRRPRLA